MESNVAQPFFLMRNNHSDHAGVAPQFSNQATGRYFGYFENRHGEQFVFVYDRIGKKAELYSGDAGWETGYVVAGGKVSLLLDQEEQQWLDACWQSVTRSTSLG